MFAPLPSDTELFAVVRTASPVRTQVEYHLRQAILSGHFRPGDRLIERELRALLGVSRTSLREALRHLEDHGLVQNIPQKGLVVATMTREEAEEIYQVRTVVEELAGRLFAERAGSEELAALQEALAAVEVAERSGALPPLVVAKDHFYAVLVGGAGNRTMSRIAQSLKDRIAWLRFLTLAQPGRASQSVVEMRCILMAVLAGDPEGAAQACVEHVQAAAAVAAEVFHQQEAETRAERESGEDHHPITADESASSTRDPARESTRRLGQRLRRARLDRNLTQGEVAQNLFSISYVSAVERGQIRPSLGALEKLAERLQVPVTELLDTVFNVTC
jgi:GntR family transcriptional regulator, trigonelline degradation regulator